jgi:PKD repeat protein
LCAGFTAALHAQDTAPAGRLFKRLSRPVPADNPAPVGPTVAPRGTGLNIVVQFDSSITNNARAADIMTTINAAVANYKATYSDSVTVNILFKNMNSGLGQSSTWTGTYGYPAYRAALVTKATTADDTSALAHLPSQTNNPVNNDPNMTVATALARALGFTDGQSNPPSGQADSEIDINIGLTNILSTDNNPNNYPLNSVFCHEMDEALGFGSNLDSGKTTGAPYPEDLFRYDQTGTGTRAYSTSPNAQAYFSIDGTTNLARFNNDASQGDTGDWYSPGNQTPQVQDATGTPGSSEVLGVELRVLDVIGYTRGSGGGGGGGPTITSAAGYAPDPALAGSPVTFSVAATETGKTLTYSWDFGDGTGKGTGASATHTYGTAGTYTATVTVSDGTATATSSVSVTVVNKFNQGTNSKQSFTLNFKTQKDSISITMNAADFSTGPGNSNVAFLIGATSVDTGTLFRNKATGNNLGKFSLSTKTGSLQYTTTKASLESLLAPYGATSASLTVATVKIPIYFKFNGLYYGNTFDFNYTVNKSGTTGKGK